MIFIIDCGKCSSDDLFKVLPSLTGTDVFSISAPSCLKIPNLTSLVNEQRIIFVESISPFLWTHGILGVSRDLKDLTDRGKILVLNVHSDTLLDKNDSQRLRYMSTACIQVLKQMEKHKFLVKISIKKKHQTEIVEICGRDVKSSVVSHTIQQSIVSSPAVTTFNLGVNLSETEKQAKDSLILPYLR